MARVVFLGTPQYAVPALRALIEHNEVAAVVSQPDRRAGRGRRRLVASPVKELAREHGLAVLQPRRLSKDAETLRFLRDVAADVFVLAAYGQILSREVLAIPPQGCIGLHASLLPKLRGAAPIAAAILQGCRTTGVTLMLTDQGVDTGPIIAQESLPIAPDDTTPSLTEKLSHLGAWLLIGTLPAWLAGRIDVTPQDDARATYAPQLDKGQGEIDWRRSAAEIDRQIRALCPWPSTFTTYQGRRFKVLEAAPLPGQRDDVAPGTVIETGKDIAVATGDGLLTLTRVQPAGKRAMDAAAFARGRADLIGSRLG